MRHQNDNYYTRGEYLQRSQNCGEKDKEISVAQRRQILQKDRGQRRLADAKVRLTKTIDN